MAIPHPAMVVPRTDEAADLIFSHDERPNDYICVELEDAATPLFVFGFFDYINATIGSLIDEYEEEVIPADRIGELQNAVRAFRKNRAYGPRVTDALDRIEAALQQAAWLCQPAWFFL